MGRFPPQAHAAQGPMQPDPEYLRGWGICSFSGRPALSELDRKRLLWNVPYCHFKENAEMPQAAPAHAQMMPFSSMDMSADNLPHHQKSLTPILRHYE